MSIKKFCITSVLVVILAGCTKMPVFVPRYLTPLNQDNAQYEKTIDNVTVRISKFDRESSIDLFGKQGDNLYLGNKKKHIYPFQLTIANRSDRIWILDRYNIGLPMMNKRDVAERLFVTDTNRAILYSALGMGTSILLFGAGLGCMLAGKLSAAYATKTIFYTGVALTSVSAFPTAITESHNNHYAQTIYDINTMILNDIERKSVPFTSTLHPNVMLNALMFVQAKDWMPEFTITLLDQADESKMLIFNVQMEEKQWRKISS